jgi:hypothetical protein
VKTAIFTGSFSCKTPLSKIEGKEIPRSPEKPNGQVAFLAETPGCAVNQNVIYPFGFSCRTALLPNEEV